MCVRADRPVVLLVSDDNRAEDLTKEVSKWHTCFATRASLICLRCLLVESQGMRQGIITSGAFILFLSAGILSRPFCQFEIREAIARKKPMILIRTCLFF